MRTKIIFAFIAVVAILLIRTNELYHFGMTPAELYDATRSAWKMGTPKEQAFQNMTPETSEGLEA